MPMSDYEHRALDQIHAWKTDAPSWFEKVSDTMGWPIAKATELISKAPGAEWVISNTVGGLVSLINDFAQWSVRPDAIYGEFRKKGLEVSAPKDLLRLDLEEIDRSIGWLAAKYKGAAAVEGVVTGTGGLVLIPPDVVALVGMNLRAAGEYATYCAFDVSRPEERLFALYVLSYASSPKDAAKAVILSQLVRIATDVARRVPWKDLDKHLFVQAIRAIAKVLGVRLTKAKLAQILPVLGGAIGGGFNAYYTNRVCDAAFFLYRERFLAAKYGPEVIEQTVKPAAGIEQILDVPADVKEVAIDVVSYGSQFHLRRLVNERSTELSDMLASAYSKAGLRPPSRVEWISPLARDGYRELEGMEYFVAKGDTKTVDLWKAFWPQSGRAPTWDGWAIAEGAEGREFLFVEAKANEPELESPPCGALPEGLAKIREALDKAKAFLGVASDIPWHKTYYQFCNRLACLYFLNEVAKVPARFLCVYFVGDRFPDGRPCPISKEAWKVLTDRMYAEIGLPGGHPFKSRILSIYPSV